jgi:hypothetical protein
MTEQLNTETAQPARRATLLDLSFTQLIAGSLAAATAAFLGSRLGWVGTITGAAIGSVVSAVASSLYTASMTRAREALRWQNLHTRQAQSSMQTAPAPSESSVQLVLAASQSSMRKLPRWAPRRVLATAGVLFALAVAFLTGLQLATGADVTGTSLGPRQSTTEVEQGAPGGEEPDPAVPATEPSATPAATAPPTPESSSSATTEQPDPAIGQSDATSPAAPAEPTPTQSGPADPASPATPTPTQPSNEASPTTPAG